MSFASRLMARSIFHFLRWDKQGRNVLLFFRTEYCLFHVCCYDECLVELAVRPSLSLAVFPAGQGLNATIADASGCSLGIKFKYLHIYFWS